MNRVELQNGCLSLGHANTFIPSTLGGSCIDRSTGNIETEKLRNNMNLAIETYISRVNGCPCGNTVIQLHRGSDATEEQAIRLKLLVFLKGSNIEKADLQNKEPYLYKHFEQVWKVRNDHMVPHLPTPYVFFLVCCYQDNCLHPCCQAGEPGIQGGPLSPTCLIHYQILTARGATSPVLLVLHQTSAVATMW